MKFLTPETLALFIDFAHISSQEERDPEVLCTSRKDKGHITNLKKAGVITTYVCEGDELGILWVSFTDKGKALAAAHGINVFDNATGLPYEPGVAHDPPAALYFTDGGVFHAICCGAASEAAIREARSTQNATGRDRGCGTDLHGAPIVRVEASHHALAVEDGTVLSCDKWPSCPIDQVTA